MVLQGKDGLSWVPQTPVLLRQRLRGLQGLGSLWMEQDLCCHRQVGSPVGAAEAVALAGGEVGLVHGLHVGLGVGAQPARRPRGAHPAAEHRAVSPTARTRPEHPSLRRASGQRWLIAPVTWRATSSCFGSVTQLWSFLPGPGGAVGTQI